MEKYHVTVEDNKSGTTIYDVKGGDLSPLLTNIRSGIVDDKLMSSKLRGKGVEYLTISVYEVCAECGQKHKIQEFKEYL